MTEPRCFRILYFRPVRYFLNLGKRSHRGARSAAGAESLQPFPALKTANNSRLVVRTLLLTDLPFETSICIAGP